MGLVTITNDWGDKYTEPDYHFYKNVIESIVATQTSDGWAERVEFRKDDIKITYTTFIPTLKRDAVHVISYSELESQIRENKVENLLLLSVMESSGFVATYKVDGFQHYTHPKLDFTYRVIPQLWLEQLVKEDQYNTICRTEETELSTLLANPSYKSYKD